MEKCLLSGVYLLCLMADLCCENRSVRELEVWPI